MSKESDTLYLYNAPQCVEFGAEEASDIDKFFDNTCCQYLNSIPETKSSLNPPAPSNGTMHVPSFIISDFSKDDSQNFPANTETQDIHRNSPALTAGNPALEKLKNSYRTHSNNFAWSAASSPVCSTSPSVDSPSLEYAKPWLNEVSDSLVNAMNSLAIKSAKAMRNRSVTPGSQNKNERFMIITSTPCITTEPRSTRFAEKNTNCEEIQHRNENNEFFETAGQSSGSIPTSDALSTVKEVSNSSTTQPPIVDRNSVINENPTEASSSNERPSDKEIFETHVVNAETRVKTDNDEPKTSGGRNGRRSSSRRVLTSQVRRQSQKYRRRSGKFVSMAEAILKFQRATPKRFRSTSNQNPKAGPSRTNAQTSRKPNCPTSPSLRCKSRSKSSTSTNLNEPKITETKENRENRIQSNPPIPKKITEKSPRKTEKSLAKSAVSDLRSSSNLSNLRGKKNIDNTIPNARNSRTSMHRNVRSKKTVVSVVSTETEPKFKTIEICNFGLPATGSTRKLTQAVPFKLSENCKKIQAKREEKERENAKCSSTTMDATSCGIAKSSSATTTKTSSTAIPEAEPGTSGQQRTTFNSKTMLALDFEQRNNLLLKKRKELERAAIEKEKQMRIFHAKPAPKFKIPTVAGVSVKNSRVECNDRTRGASSRASSPDGSIDRENRSPNVAIARSGFRSPAHTQERLKKRNEFDEKQRMKHEEEQTRLRKEEAERLEALQQENMELRKTMEPKAKPVPDFTAPRVVKSLRPLTVPQTPLCLKRSKNRANLR